MAEGTFGGKDRGWLGLVWILHGLARLPLQELETANPTHQSEPPIRGSFLRIPVSFAEGTLCGVEGKPSANKTQRNVSGDAYCNRAFAFHCPVLSIFRVFLSNYTWSLACSGLKPTTQGLPLKGSVIFRTQGRQVGKPMAALERHMMQCLNMILNMLKSTRNSMILDPSAKSTCRMALHPESCWPYPMG